MKLFYSIILSGLIGVFALSAVALDLQTARSSGLVTEKADGYVAAAKPSPEVDALVKEVNAKRLAEYTKISKENGQSVDVVAKLAAGQIKAKMGK
jgi:uncharacterized protein YdbL (DUF1318 family)